ncbi:MAG: hypothetical protein R2733_03660 [Acidimicrobiales bacterium]
MSSAADPDALAALVEDLAADIERGRRGRARVYGPDDELTPAAQASLDRMAPLLEERHRTVFGDK